MESSKPGTESKNTNRSKKLAKYEQSLRAVVGESPKSKDGGDLYYPFAEPLGGSADFAGEARHGFARPFRRLTAGPAMGDLRAKKQD